MAIFLSTEADLRRYSPSLISPKTSRRLALLGCSVMLLASAVALFASGAASAAAVDPKAVFSSTCMGCHGAKGEGSATMGAPNIAGMDATYVARQLNHFANGQRGTATNDSYGAQMRGAVTQLPTEADRQAMAVYVAGLPKVAAKVSYQGVLSKGSTQYNAVCSSCHEARAQGNAQMGAPALTGLDPRYMERQIMAFREGRRGTHPDDRQGALMKVGASMLPDTASVHDVIAYIMTIKP